MAVSLRGVTAAVCGAVAITSLAGCGGDDEKPLVEPQPTTVGAVSEGTARAPVIRDMTAIRNAIDDNSRGGVDRLYAFLNRANTVGKKDINRSAAMIRRGVPPIVEAYAASFPRLREALLTLQLETTTGREIRRYALFLAKETLQTVKSLRNDLRTSPSAWAAVDRWGRRNNRLVAESRRRLDIVFKRAPEQDREAIMAAVQEVFGG
jgi:hypothetical protein